MSIRLALHQITSLVGKECIKKKRQLNLDKVRQRNASTAKRVEREKEREITKQRRHPEMKRNKSPTDCIIPDQNKRLCVHSVFSFAHPFLPHGQIEVSTDFHFGSKAGYFQQFSFWGRADKFSALNWVFLAKTTNWAGIYHTGSSFPFYILCNRSSRKNCSDQCGATWWALWLMMFNKENGKDSTFKSSLKSE